MHLYSFITVTLLASFGLAQPVLSPSANPSDVHVGKRRVDPILSPGKVPSHTHVERSPGDPIISPGRSGSSHTHLWSSDEESE